MATRGASLHRRLPLLAGLLLLGLSAWLSASLAAAELEANILRDVVTLSDGTKIQCLILGESKRRMLVLVKDADKESGIRQQVIETGGVKEILRGQDEGQKPGLDTGETTEGPGGEHKMASLGHRRKPKEEEKPREPVKLSGAIAPVKPLVLPNPDANAGGVKPSATKLAAPDLAETYLMRFPALKEAADAFLGGSANVPSQLQKALEGDPTARDQWRNTLEMCLAAETTREPRPGVRHATGPKDRSAPPVRDRK